MATSRAYLLIEGKVQGVYYRVFTQKEAQSLGLTGWVRNCADGKVESVAEGERSKIEDLISWCRKGPAEAKVRKITVKWEAYQGEFAAFDIVPDRR